MGSKEPINGKSNGPFNVEKNNRTVQKSGSPAEKLDNYGSLGHAIESVISAGAYISFGRTSDGGATLIRILDGDDKLTSYCHSHSEVLEAMEALEQRYKRKVLVPLSVTPRLLSD